MPQIFIKKKDIVEIEKDAFEMGLSIPKYIEYLSNQVKKQKSANPTEPDKKEQKKNVKTEKGRLIRNEEFSLTPEEDRICIGVACKLKEDNEFLSLIKEQNRCAIEECLSDVIDVARVQKRHPTYNDMVQEIKDDEELNTEIEDENEDENTEG